MKLNVGCGTFYAEGWTNTDRQRTDVPGHVVQPDMLVTREEPFPFDYGTFERAYLGHVLEHVPWEFLPTFLAQLCRVMAPGGQIMFVGPDIVRTLDRFKAGEETWDGVFPVLEGSGGYVGDGQFTPIVWGQDRHYWNSDERRVVDVLTVCGLQAKGLGLIENDWLPDLAADGWPLVSQAPNQYAVSVQL